MTVTAITGLHCKFCHKSKEGEGTV